VEDHGEAIFDGRQELNQRSACRVPSFYELFALNDGIGNILVRSRRCPITRDCSITEVIDKDMAAIVIRLQQQKTQIISLNQK